MNSLILMIIASVIRFLMITLGIIYFLLCITIALLCWKMVKIFQKLDEIEFSSHKERVSNDFINAKNKCLCGDDYLKCSAPRWLINYIVLSFWDNIEPRMRESALVRLATFVICQQEVFGQFYFTELAEAGFFFDVLSSSICCCRCTSQFRLKKIPKERGKWHVSWCHFCVPAQVGHNTTRTEVDHPRNIQLRTIQETTNRHENMNTEHTGLPASLSRQAHVLTTSQLVLRTGPDQQPITLELSQDPAVSSNQPRTGSPAATVSSRSTDQQSNLSPEVSPYLTTVLTTPSYPVYSNTQKRLESFTNWPSSHIHTPAHLASSGFFYAGYGDCVRCFQCGLRQRSWKPGDDVTEEHNRHRPSCPFLQAQIGSGNIEFYVTNADVACASDERQKPKSLPLSLLEQENKNLKLQMTCKICLKAPITILFLPCGDLCACSDCAQKLMHCPLCKKQILGTVTTYFS